MRRPRCRPVAAALASFALLLVVSGCSSSHALGLHDSHVIEGLPMPEYREAWYGVPLGNSTGAPVELQSMRLVGATGLDLGTPFVVDITHGDYIDWHAPPGTTRMQAEIAHRVPLTGFTVPPHTHRQYEAVVLAAARSRDVAASIRGARIRYRTAGRSAEETWMEGADLTVSH